MNFTKQQVRQLRRDNMMWPEKLDAIPADKWPQHNKGERPRIQVFRSRDFLVQAFEEPDGVVRLSVNRTDWDIDKGRWREDISWDDLQRLKAEAGYQDRWAVEVFPPDWHVVNVANMRHIWLLPAAPSFAWMGSRKAAE